MTVRSEEFAQKIKDVIGLDLSNIIELRIFLRAGKPVIIETIQTIEDLEIHDLIQEYRLIAIEPEHKIQG